MMGREAYRNPYLLSHADALFFGDEHPIPSRHEIIEAVVPYVTSQVQTGMPLSRMTRHLLGLFQGLPGAKKWRRHLSENAPNRDAGVEVLQHALALVDDSPINCI